MKITRIIVAWLKVMGLVDIKEAEKRMSENRMLICSGCEYGKESKVLTLINGSAKDEDVLYCTICKCPCKQKTVVASETCPKKKW